MLISYIGRRWKLGRLSVVLLVIAVGASMIGPAPAWASGTDPDTHVNCDGGGCAWADANVWVTGSYYVAGMTYNWPTWYGHKIKSRGYRSGTLVLSDDRGPANTTGWSKVGKSGACDGAVSVWVDVWGTGNGTSSYAHDSASGICDPEASPLVIDLDRSGTIEIADKPTNFDMDGDGTLEQLAQWIEGSGDGLLYDATLPGAMSGLQLFGDQGGTYPTGYEKLGLRDVDQNGVLNGSELDGLAVWIDNGNARFNQFEGLSLSEIGVESISLSYDDDLRSQVVLRDSEPLLVEDMFFDLRHTGGE